MPALANVLLASISLIGFALIAPEQVQAEVVTCDAVVKIAEVYHGRDVSITFTSSKDKQYCRFSINGFVAATGVPENFSTNAADAHFFWTEMAKTQKPDANVVKLLPFLLFAADEKFDESQFQQATDIVQKDFERLFACYENFFAGKDVDEPLADGSLVCRSEGERLETAFTAGDIVRRVYIHRA